MRRQGRSAKQDQGGQQAGPHEDGGEENRQGQARQQPGAPAGFGHRYARGGARARWRCIVLAAGKGTRMKSSRAKVLHTILGAPLCAYPIDRARELGADPVVAVLGHQRAEVEAALTARYGAGTVTTVEQAEQRGTGHAVKVGLAPLAQWQGLALVLYGDAPLLRRETVEALLAEARRTGGLALLTAVLPDPTGYGRILRDRKGRVLRVVEEKDCTPAERKLKEINAGFYAAPIDFLRAATAALQPNNAQGEYYLTDMVEIAGQSIGAHTVQVTPEEIAGINDRQQLIAAEEVMRRRMHRPVRRPGDVPRSRQHGGRAGGGDRHRRGDRPQRLAAREHAHRRRRAHRRRGHPQRHPGRGRARRSSPTAWPANR